jgi:aryl-alcohol dehydrogenase-like predicted oxidoreductase
VKMRELGRTGIQVSPYCLGTMMFGQSGNTDEDDCVRIIHRALEAGINFVDTADVYGPGGKSEEIVGRALKGRRDDIVLATKVNGSMGEDPNRGIEREVLPTCQRYGMGTLVWSPLAMGLLTGRYRKGRPEPRNARMNWVPRHLTDERKLDAVEQLIPLAAEAGLSLTHLAIAFAVTHPAVTSAIIGPRTMEQIEDLLAGAATVLDDEVLDRIDQIVAPGTDIGPLDVSYTPPALNRASLRRRSADERTAA